MDKSTFSILKAMVKRDLLVQRRSWQEFFFRVAMLPFILILTYGYVLPRIGLLPETFPNSMFPGVLGMSLLVTGIHGTAVPLSMDFHNSREIEDKLQAPVSVQLVAISKMIVGIIEAWIGALLVLPISLIFMGSELNISMNSTEILWLILILILSSFASATLGLLVGTIVKPSQIAAMFPGFLMPVIFAGAVFFRWESLRVIPLYQYLVLINPLVYINEALRYVMNSSAESMPLLWSILGIIGFTILMGTVGMRRFKNMSTN